MTTLNLGAIRLNWRGDWTISDTYANRDVVAYGGDSFVCIAGHTGQAPKTGTVLNSTYWQYMAKGANQLTTKGDTLWHDGTSHARIPVGNSGNVLTVGASNSVGWSAPSGYEGSTFLVGTRPWLAAPNLVGTGNEPWLGDVNGDNMRIATGMPNPTLGARQWRHNAYHGGARMMALNNKYEFVARGDQSYAVVGAQASSNNKNSTTPFYDIQGENGLMKTGDFFVQIHQIGSGAVIALTRLGDVWFKGYNTQGWAGNGHTTDCYGWVKIPYLGPDASVSSKSCRIIGLTTSQHINGGNYDNITIYAIDSSYRLWTWGYNGNGECGIGNTTSPQTTPQLVTAITNCRMVAAGIYHVMAVDNTGQLYTWGHNAQGQLGTGNTTAYTSPQLIPGATNVYDIATSSGTYYSAGWNYYYHSYYLTNDGRLYGSGYNSYGELGNGNTTNQSSFTRCNPSLTFSDFVLSGSPVYQSIMALGGTPGSNSGLLYGWGYNGNGQTGNGTTTATQSSAVRPDTLCDTTRNRVKSYVNGVMSDSSRPFPRDNITKIAPIAYSESGSGFFVWDNYNRMYIIGYGYQMGTYRTDQSGIAYSRPVLMPSPWSGESGNATPYSYDIIAYNTEGYLYSAGVYNAKMQTSDGRIWWMGSQSDGEYTNDGNFSGRWQQWGM